MNTGSEQLDEAIRLIEELPSTGTALGLGKLILSLYNRKHPFGLGECVKSFDKERDAFAMRIVIQYLNSDETDALRAARRRVIELMPGLVDVSAARNAGDPTQSVL